jgi:hypothetical protein
MTFSPRVKIALLATVIAVFFLVVLLVVLPTVLVNRPDTKAAIQRYLSAAIGGEVGFDQVKLTLFPRVCATVGRPRLDLPDKVSARATEIDVGLKLLPLLRGRVVLDAVKLRSPEIRLAVAPPDTAGAGPGFPDPRLLLARMADLVKQIPESAIEATGGRLLLFGSDGNRFEFRNVHLGFHHSGAELEWTLQAEADFLKAFAAKGRLDADSAKGTATFQVTDFRPQPLQAFFLPGASFHVLDTRLDLDVSVALEGPGRATATIAGKAPTFAFGYKLRDIHLSIDRFSAQLELSEKRLAVSISELLTRTPRAALEFSFVIDEKAHPKIDIGLTGRGELAGVRDLTLALLPEDPDARLVCDILRSGDARDIRVNLHGDSWDELSKLNNLRIQGRLENGRVYLPWIDLDLNEVSGDALIAGGILDGRDLKAHYKGTRGENGTLRVGLSSADPVLQLDIFARAELAPLPPLLARVVPDPGFRQEVALVQEFSGTAQGTLRLDGTHTDVSVEVKASELDVKARYQHIPYSIRFQGGEFAYDGDSITLRGVDVTIGNSTLFRHDVRIGLTGNFPLESSSPKAVIDQSEIFNLFRDLPPFNHLHRLDGILTFNNWQLKGQAFAPSTWMLVSAGTLQGLALESEHLPGLLSLPSGSFDWQGRTLRYESAKGSINRSEIKGLTLEADWTGPARVQLRSLELDASIADVSQILQSFPETATYAAALHPMSGTARMREVRFQTRLLPEGPILGQFEAVLKDSVITSALSDLPLTLISGRIGWESSKLDFQVARASQGQSEIQNLSVHGDWSSNGDLELRADSALIECGEIFPQLMSVAGLASLREDVRGIQGTLSASNVSLKGPLQDPRRWRIQAVSEFKDIAVTTTFLDDPIELPMGGLTLAETDAKEAGSTALHLDSTHVRIGADEAFLAGDITLSAAGTTLNLNITAGAVDWNKIEKISDRVAKRRKADSRPVHARLNLRLERLVLDPVHLYPLYAEVQLSAEGARIEIERTGFCGMTLIGRVAFDGPMVDAYLVPVVDVMPLDGVIACLSEEKSLFSGNFNLDGQLGFRGRHEDLVRALNGRLTFVAEDGTIRQSLLFTRLFSLLNLTEIYRGKLPDFRSQGLDYKRSTAMIEVRDGKILISDWSIDGPTLWMGSRGQIDIASQEIDFTIMVSPFKTIDRIINSIPGLRWILGGRLVAIPMKATGNLEDPQITALSPSAVGTSILEMIERTLLLPIEIIQPLVPGMQATPSGTITR